MQKRPAPQPQAPSLGDKAYLLDKEYREEFASMWQNVQNMEDFARFARWSQDVADDKRRAVENSGDSLRHFIVWMGSFNLDLVERGLKQADMASEIEFTELLAGEKREENLAFFYLAFHAFGQGYDKNCLEQYRLFLRQHFPIWKKSEAEPLPRTAVDIVLEKAFDSQPELTRDVAEPLHQQIKEHFHKYKREFFLAPYCALIGPSGVGKSYAIRQIAHHGQLYVAYVNFDESSIDSFPKRSLLADFLVPSKKQTASEKPQKSSTDKESTDKEGTDNGAPQSGTDLRHDYTTLFEAYIAYSILFVEVCRQRGLSAKCHYDLQTRPEFRQFQQMMKAHVGSLYKTVLGKWNLAGQSEATYKRIRSEGTFPFDYQEYIGRFLDEFKNKIMSDFEAAFLEIPNTKGYEAERPKDYKIGNDELGVLLCFDEAGALFSPGGQFEDSKFVALRRALRHQATTSFKQPFKRFFGIFLETASRVSQFYPSKGRDFSQHRGDEHLDLMKPFFGPDTFDLFAPSPKFMVPFRPKEDKLDYVQSLFSYG